MTTTPADLLSPVQTRGDFRALSERASRDKPSESENARQVPADHPVWDLWEVIRGAFPGPAVNWPDAPELAWVYAIDDLTPQQIETGVRRMVREGGEFPPSAPTFRAFCLVHWEHRRQELAAENRPPLELEHAPSRESRRRLALREIRKIREACGWT